MEKVKWLVEKMEGEGTSHGCEIKMVILRILENTKLFKDKIEI